MMYPSNSCKFPTLNFCSKKVGYKPTNQKQTKCWQMTVEIN